MSTKKLRVVLLEDDAFLSETIEQHIADIGGHCECYGTLAKAEPLLRARPPAYFIADAAVPIGRNSRITTRQARAGFAAGQAFIQLARKRWRKTKFAIITALPSQELANWCAAHDVDYRIKPIDRTYLEQFLEVRRRRAFVVHGRTMSHVELIKRALSKTGIDPVVLIEQPSKGMTVIEKFEKNIVDCDLAVVALSADDLGGFAGKKLTLLTRARQNVVFELGYFYGAMKRSSGKVVLLDFGIGDLPSDLAGIVRIDGRIPFGDLCKKLHEELSP